MDSHGCPKLPAIAYQPPREEHEYRRPHEHRRQRVRNFLTRQRLGRGLLHSPWIPTGCDELQRDPYKHRCPSRELDVLHVFVKDRKLRSRKFGDEVAQRASQPKSRQRRDHEVSGTNPAVVQVGRMLPAERAHLSDNHRDGHPDRSEANEQQTFTPVVNACAGEHTDKECHQRNCTPSSVDNAQRKDHQEHGQGGHCWLTVNRSCSEDSCRNSTRCPDHPSRTEHRPNRNAVDHQASNQRRSSRDRHRQGHAQCVNDMVCRCLPCS